MILTNREMTLIYASAYGLEDKQTSSVLGISKGTIQNQWLNLRSKMATQTRTETVVDCLKYGLINIDAIQLTPSSRNPGDYPENQ